MEIILLETMGPGPEVRVVLRGKKKKLVDMLTAAIVAHPGFADLILKAIDAAADHVENGGSATITNLNDNPVHPSEN